MTNEETNEPLHWIINDEFYACHQWQEIRPGQYIAVGYVCDMDRVPTGDLFHLIETDGEVEMVFTGPPEVFERVQSMYSLALTDWYEEVEE